MPAPEGEGQCPSNAISQKWAILSAEAERTGIIFSKRKRGGDSGKGIMDCGMSGMTIS